MAAINDHVRMKKPRNVQRALIDIGQAAPQVMAMRMMRLCMAGPNPDAADRCEWQRMHEEKVEAWQEGGWAMGEAAARIQQRMWSEWSRVALEPWRWPAMGQGWMLAASRDGETLLASALAPARRRVVANARRLKRSR